MAAVCGGAEVTVNQLRFVLSVRHNTHFLSGNAIGLAVIQPRPLPKVDCSDDLLIYPTWGESNSSGFLC